MMGVAALQASWAQGQRSAEATVQAALAAADAPAAAHVFTARTDAAALAAARAADARRAAGVPPLSALDGCPVSVKDLFDVAGLPTWAGAPRLRAEAPPAADDAPAVQRLRQAGAAILGKTQMTELAFSGVGINPHTGTPANPAYAAAAAARIPGGSSSGAAVSVGLGLAVAGLGTDTGGSLRIPAALCGLVGFKPTQRRSARGGVLPLAPSLDTVGAITRSVDDAVLLDALLAEPGCGLRVPPRAAADLRLLCPTTLLHDDADPAVLRAFERALEALRAAGVRIDERPLPLLAEVVHRNAPGGLSAIEAHAAYGAELAARPEAFDPRVARRIALGRTVTATEYLHLLAARAEWQAAMTRALAPYTAWIAPTVPIRAPLLQTLLEDDAAFATANGLLLRNTFFANFHDGCSISLPCHGAGEEPVGLMLSASGGHDAALLAAARVCEAVLRRARGPEDRHPAAAAA